MKLGLLTTEKNVKLQKPLDITMNALAEIATFAGV